MRIDIEFIGRAAPLAALYEGLPTPEFEVNDSEQPARGLLVPGTGDLVLLRMYPGPDIRRFRCTRRLFDFSESGRSALRLLLDMAE